MAYVLVLCFFFFFYFLRNNFSFIYIFIIASEEKFIVPCVTRILCRSLPYIPHRLDSQVVSVIERDLMTIAQVYLLTNTTITLKL